MLGNGAMWCIGASHLDILDKMLVISVGMVINIVGQIVKANLMQEELKCHKRTGQGQRMWCVIWRNCYSKKIRSEVGEEELMSSAAEGETST